MRTFILLFCGVLLLAMGTLATQVAVHYQEGVTHGFLILRETNGRLIADGENSQTASGSTVRSRVTFHFKDGSFYEDTTVYTDHGVFHLVSDHAIQKGPSFKSQMETYIDTSTGEVSVKYSDKGKPKFIRQKMNLPADVSNGLLYIIVKNIEPSPAATVSYVGFTPKPRLVKLAFTREGHQKFFTDATSHQAIHYVMKVEIGGVTGLVASLLKKIPPDTQFWMLDSTPPSFAGSEGPLYGDGPVWRVDLVSPRRPADHPLRQNASTRHSGH